MILTEGQIVSVKIFADKVFDTRLLIAMAHKPFMMQDIKVRRRAIHTLLKQYAKIAYGCLEGKPPYELAYPAIIKLIAAESQYYKTFGGK